MFARSLMLGIACVVLLGPVLRAEEACEREIYRDDLVEGIEEAIANGEWLDASEIDDGDLLKVLIEYSRAWDEEDVDTILELRLMPNPRALQLERECLPRQFAKTRVAKWTRYIAIPDDSNPQHYLVIAGVVLELHGECTDTTWGIGHWTKLWSTWRQFEYVGKYPVIDSACPELHHLGPPVELDN